MALWGTFLYFPSSKPTVEELQGSDDIYLLTQSKFNPHDGAYAANEDIMLDWEVNIVEKSQQPKILLSEVEENPIMALEAKVSSVKVMAVNNLLEANNTPIESVGPMFEKVPNEVASVLDGIIPVLDDNELYHWMKTRAEIGRFQSSIGSTNIMTSKYLVSDDDTVETYLSTDDSEEENDSEEEDNNDVEYDPNEANILLDEIYKKSLSGEIDLDE
eukprot:1514107-Ditylum_brightwellii.AAC.1